MKAGWHTRPFDECIEKVTYTAKIQRKDFLEDGAYPIISQEDAFINGYWDNEADLFKITTPIVVFGDHTKVLKYVDFDFVLGADGVKVLQARDFLIPKFFFYQLQTANLDSLGYARHYKLLKELELAYPARPEQQRIVAILDESFGGIATAKANAEKNLQNARAIYTSMLEFLFANHETDHKTIMLGDLIETLTDYHANGSYEILKQNVELKDAEDFAWMVRSTDFENDFQNKKRYITKAAYDFLTKSRIFGGEIIMSKIGNAGKVYLMPEITRPCSLAMNVFLIRLHQDRASNKYVYRFTTVRLRFNVLI